MEKSFLSIEKENKTIPSPQSVTKAYIRFVNTLTDNTLTALETAKLDQNQQKLLNGLDSC